MRDAIARVLAWALSLLTPRRPGRHTAEYLACCVPTGPIDVSPWSKPWTGPTKDEARALFQQQAETTIEVTAVRERRRAAALATLGIDYPYTYAGAPFPASAFTTEGMSA
jgi:hypothetical protein